MMGHADPERPMGEFSTRKFLFASIFIRNKIVFPATFTVLCYNVLCDKYATSSLYSYCPSWALNWEYRKSAILKEIRHYEADIITLQVL